MTRKIEKPKPVVVTTICSICGENWAQHQEVDGEVSTLECVRLLKAKIASRPVTITYPTYVYPTWWQTTPTVWHSSGNINSTTVKTDFATCQNTPTVAVASAAA
jgi:hypothetical protein